MMFRGSGPMADVTFTEDVDDDVLEVAVQLCTGDTHVVILDHDAVLVMNGAGS